MIWQLQDAKARLSEVVRASQEHGPQEISVHGKTAAVLIAKADYDRMIATKPSFLSFMRRSPLAGMELEIERNRTPARKVRLERLRIPGPRAAEPVATLKESGPITVRWRSRLLVLGLAAAAASACACSRSTEGTTLRVLSPNLPDRLGPTADSRLGSRNVFFSVFEPLVRVDSGGHLVPAVAESWATTAPDVYEFRIRQGVRFHDGTPLGMGDVVASLERARAPGSAIAGNLADVVEIRVAHAHSVLVRTRVPTAVLIHALTAVPILKPGSPLPLGTGPYEVVEFAPGERVRLRRFAGHYEKPALLESVVFQRYRTEADVIAAILEPQATMVLDPSRAAVAAAQESGRYRVASELSGSLVYLAFDLARSPTPGVRLAVNPFRDVRVRRAFQLALDQEALIREASTVGGVPATQLAPPGVFGFDPGLPAPRQDLARSRALLAEAGHASGFEAVLDVRRNDRVLGEALARQLEKAGVRLTVNDLLDEEFTKRIDTESSLFAYNWVLGQESGEALKNFFHTFDPARGLGLRNRIGYSSPEVDRILEEAMVTLGRELRREALYAAMRRLMEDLPFVPLFADKTTRIYPRHLAFPPRIDGMLVLREARAAPEP